MAKHPTGYCPVFGNYPKEYNRAVHGPYYPWVNYNLPRDVPLKDVKLGELKGWVARRNKAPWAALAAVSRTYYSWQRSWLDTRLGSPSKGLLQMLMLISFSSFITAYPYYKSHRNHKYHW